MSILLSCDVLLMVSLPNKCVHRYISIDQSETFQFYSQEFSVTGGRSPDSFEPDNEKGSASLISIDEIQYRTVTYNDSDWIKFEADSGTVYHFIDSTNSTKLKMSIYFSENNSETASFEIPKGETLSEWLCTKTGTYYIKMAIFKSLTQSGTTGRYSITIKYGES